MGKIKPSVHLTEALGLTTRLTGLTKDEAKWGFG